MIRFRTAAAALVFLAAAGAAAGAQDTKIRGFTDVTFGASSDTTRHSAFALGQFDLYITSQLSSTVSFLGETVFEYDDAVSEFAVDVERVIVTVAPTDHFRFALGKHHTPIGYWNNAYHHGAVLQPTIERPLMFAFEDEGGILPIHTTGLLVSGRDLTRLHLAYDVMVGNGIGTTPTQDDNQAKSLTAAISSQITSALQIGANLYTDRAASGTTTLGGGTLPAAMTQRMAGGYLAFLGARVETLAEYQRVTDALAGGDSHGTDAYYGYAGVRFGRFVPYVRYDAVRFPAADPYFPSTDQTLALAGGRYDLSSTAAVKAELRSRRIDGAERSTEGAVQIAIGF